MKTIGKNILSIIFVSVVHPVCINNEWCVFEILLFI